MIGGREMGGIGRHKFGCVTGKMEEKGQDIVWWEE